MQPTVKWSNERVIEFLEMFQTEPCLWDPRLKSFKNRSAQNDAWRRLMHSLPFQVTVDELKKKKESLMGYYRIHLNKFKKSLATGIGVDDVYTTNWFAFDVMDSFLRPIYVSNSMINTESTYEEDITDEIIYIKEVPENKSETENKARTSESSSDHECLSTSASYTKNEKFEQPRIQYKKLLAPYIVNTEIKESTDNVKTVANKTKELDEYDYFAGMIASKIRKLENMDDQEELMNAIQNLTYKFYMKRKQK